MRYAEDDLDQFTAPSAANDVVAIWAKTPPPGLWASRARCQGQSPQRWVAPATRQEVDLAIEVCQRCRVRVSCAVYASDAGCSGVWGGVNLVEGVPRRWSRPRSD